MKIERAQIMLQAQAAADEASVLRLEYKSCAFSI